MEGEFIWFRKVTKRFGGAAVNGGSGSKIFRKRNIFWPSITYIFDSMPASLSILESM